MTSLIAALAEATADLWYVSETDAPLEVCQWSTATLDLAGLRQQLQLGEDQVIEQRPWEQFFQRAMAAATPAERERYRQLQQLMVTQLDGLCFYRVGTLELELYLLGRQGQQWLGVKTQAVET